MNYKIFILIKFIIHNSKSKPWNNSCKYAYTTQLQRYTSTPIHPKDDTKQNKNKNNEHNWNTIKVGEIFTYGCVNSIVVNWKEKFPLQTPHKALVFVLNVWNNIQGFHK
jgi:hypothetical protein